MKSGRGRKCWQKAHRIRRAARAAPSATSSHPVELFTSWKDIASYLGQGVRTVQRWEQQYGLPVLRPKDKTRGVVYANREDLDRWREMRGSWRGQVLRIPPQREDCPRAVRRIFAPLEEHCATLCANLTRRAELLENSRRLLTEVDAAARSITHQLESIDRNLER